MKTVQEYLRTADRERLLDSLVYDEIYDSNLLFELKDLTITEIQYAYKKDMNAFIDHLLTLKAEPTDHMILYLSNICPDIGGKSYQDKSLNLIDLNEIRKDINASSYAFDLTAWEKTLGYLVADTKLTQDYIDELLVQFLQEISFLGTDPNEHQNEVEQIWADIEEGMKEIEEGKTIPAEQALEEIRKDRGRPIDEKDAVQERYEDEYLTAKFKYNRYCTWRERSRILTSLGETPPTFEEAEKKAEKLFEETK